MGHVIQIIGALIILLGFLLAQTGRLSVQSYVYLALNLIGSVILAIDAFHGEQWGFLLMETTWAIVSLSGLVRRLLVRV